ncbi:MAG TPA: hypothetical protein PKX13_06385 [Acidiphilium sp.]|nr:hypothetical protein [Acidiphilium sp.]
MRAEFIRFLALGGDDRAPVHERGVWLKGAYVEGTLDLSSANVICNLQLDHCHFDVAPNFKDAKIDGYLILEGSRVPSLAADRATISGVVFLGQGFMSEGEIRLRGAKIGGTWNCNGGVFANSQGNALSADGIEVAGNVSMGAGFRAEGAVRLLGAKIGGQWSCKEGVFVNLQGDALIADGIEVAGIVSMGAGFRAEGEVRLLGAKIGGQWVCNDGVFANPQGNALSADQIEVAGTVSMGAGFSAEGAVRLPGAKIGGQWSCDGGVFSNEQGDALKAQGAEVKGEVFMECEAHGEVSLSRVRFHSAFYLGGQIKALDLTSARVAVLHDQAKSWPDRINLTGFVYDSFGEDAPVSGKDRIKWLEQRREDRAGDVKNPDGFKPQPWIQARKVLREMGHYEAAREVGIAFETHKRRIGLIGGSSETGPGWCPSWLWSWWRGGYRRVAEGLHWCYWAMASYGYRPLISLMFAAIVWLVCTGLYAVGSNHGVFAPTNPAIYQNPADAVCWGRPHKHPIWTRCKALPPAYTTFVSPVYSLNVLLPVGDLGQVSSWSPMTSTPLGRAVQVAVWFETLFGWVASLLLVAVLSGLVKRDE